MRPYRIPRKAHIPSYVPSPQCHPNSQFQVPYPSFPPPNQSTIAVVSPPVDDHIIPSKKSLAPPHVSADFEPISIGCDSNDHHMQSELSEPSEGTRLKCIRFLVDHAEPMVKADNELFKVSIRSLIDPLIASKVGSVCSVKNGNGNTVREMCNLSDQNNHTLKRGVVWAVRQDSGSSRSVSAGHTHACNGRLLSDSISKPVIDDHSSLSLDAIDAGSHAVRTDFALRSHTVFNMKGKSLLVYHHIYCINCFPSYVFLIHFHSTYHLIKLKTTMN